jgi:hypothetical protein
VNDRRVEKVDSTRRVADELAQTGVPQGTVALVEEQRALDELMLIESRRRKQNEHPLVNPAKKRTEAPTASE